MKLHINRHLRRALMTCMSMGTMASLTLPLYAADYENNALVTYPDNSVFSDSSYRNSYWLYAVINGAVFQSTDLTGSNFDDAELIKADFSNSNLTGVSFIGADLSQANLSNSIILGANFYDNIGVDAASLSGKQTVTHAMLMSTASYKQKDFFAVDFSYTDMSGFNFSGMNLAAAYFRHTDLKGANFTDAIIGAANFSRAENLTQEMLRQTYNYQKKDFSGIDFTAMNMSNFDFSNMNLVDADLSACDLSGANFSNAVITEVNFSQSQNLTADMLKKTKSYSDKNFSKINFGGQNLNDFDLTGFNLSGTRFSGAHIERAKFDNATISGANLSNATGLTHQMLTSTASYKNKDFTGVALSGVILTGFQFTGINLTGASLSGSTLTNADFTDATITHAHFEVVTGFTKAMLESTASYKNKDLSRINFGSVDLTGFDFTGMNLSNANFFDGDLENAILKDATITGVVLMECDNVTGAMLLDTASYKNKDFSSIVFGKHDMTGADFSGVDFTNASFNETQLKDADFTDAIIQVVNFSNALGVTSAQLMQTASYQTKKDFSGVNLNRYDLQGMDFSGFDLTAASIDGANVTGVSFDNADLRGARTNATGYNPSFYENHLDSEGNIHNMSLNTSTDVLTIRGGADTARRNLLSSAKLRESETISDGATLTLVDNAQLYLRDNAQLTLAPTGNLNIELDNSNTLSSPSILIEKGSSLELAQGAKLHITLTGDLTQGYDFNLISWQDSANATALIALIESGEAFTITDANGLAIEEDLTLSADGKSFVLTDKVTPGPTPPGPTPPVQDLYSDLSSSGNGAAGAAILNYASDQIIKNGTQVEDRSIAAVLQTLNNISPGTANSQIDQLLAAVAGAGVTSLGSASLSSAEGELKRVLSRSTALLPAGKREFWISAQMSNTELDSSGTAAGHSLDSWGGSAGVNWGLKEDTTIGFALTALYGDLDAESVDAATGDLDSYYLSLVAAHQRGKWQHRAALSWGLSEGSLARSVEHTLDRYSSSGDTDGYSLSLAYELGYDIKLSESSTLTPIFNATLIHSYLDSYTESGGAALHVGEQENTIATLGVGARITSKLDMGIQLGARALIKVDAGDRAQEADVSFANYPNSTARITGSEAGAFGLELGVGASMPVGEAGAIFLDASTELRDKQQDVNASVGYRMSF